jgi:hypothetical protein
MDLVNVLQVNALQELQSASGEELPDKKGWAYD